MRVRLFTVSERARMLGYRDAQSGRMYRYSVEQGSWLRSWLDEYEEGWKAGREK